MNRIGRTTALTLGAALLTTLIASTASAGCGSYDPERPRSYDFESNAVQTQSDAQQSGVWYSDGDNSVVGMRRVSFTAGWLGYTDFGCSQWHDDGTELLKSGGDSLMFTIRLAQQ